MPHKRRIRGRSPAAASAAETRRFHDVVGLTPVCRTVIELHRLPRPPWSNLGAMITHTGFNLELSRRKLIAAAGIGGAAILYQPPSRARSSWANCRRGVVKFAFETPGKLYPLQRLSASSTVIPDPISRYSCLT
jgi:hypothetical protein